MAGRLGDEEAAGADVSAEGGGESSEGGGLGVDEVPAGLKVALN